jgi:hypothetical protein
MFQAADGGFFAGAFLATGFLAAGFFAGVVLAGADGGFLAGAFAAGFLAAGFVEDAVLLLYNFVPATAAAAVAKTAPATAADLPGLSLITLPADVAASLAVVAALLAVSEADLAADFAPPVTLSAKSRSFSLARSNAPPDLGDLAIFHSSSKSDDKC